MIPSLTIADKKSVLIYQYSGLLSQELWFGDSVCLGGKATGFIWVSSNVVYRVSSCGQCTRVRLHAVQDPYEMVTYPRAGHVPSERAHKIDIFTQATILRCTFALACRAVLAPII